MIARTLPAVLLAALPAVAAGAGDTATIRGAGSDPAFRYVGGDTSFRYQEPQESHRLRAAGLVGGYVGLQLLTYTLTPRPPDPRYELVYTPSDKLFHGAVSYDSNAFRTNFVAHPTMGTIMYLMARGSRLPAWEASLWAIGGSTTWELVEYHETASINDLIVTPLVGISVGEPFFQLGAHLDRGPPSTGRTVLSWIVSPFKKLNDLADHATPARGDPDDHLVAWTRAGGGATAGGGERGDIRLGGGWRLVRDGDYGAPGHDLRRWLDGQVTEVALAAAFGSGGLLDGRFESSALLASLYARDLDADGRGADLVAGAGVGFELRNHRWTPGGQADFAGLAQIPRATAEARWLSGDLALTARLDASFLFAGTSSLALDRVPAAVSPEQLPTGQREYGYHFGLGAGIHPAIEAALGPASVAAGWRAEWLPRTSQQPDPTPGHEPTARLEERWSDVHLRAAWRFAGGLELGAEAEWRLRWSRADATTVTASDHSLGLTVGFVSGAR